MRSKPWLAAGTMVVGGLALLGVHPARASVMTVSTNVSIGGFTLTDAGYDLSLPTFNPSLGTLTDVTARFFGDLRPAILGIGNLPQPTPATITLTPFLALEPGQIHGTFAPEIVPVTGVHNDAIGVWEPFSLQQSLPVSGYIGGPNTLPAQFFLRGYSLSNDFNFAASDALDDLTVSGVLALDYTYTPSGTAVPEPGSLALLLSGLISLGGIGFVTRRSKTA